MEYSKLGAALNEPPAGWYSLPLPPPGTAAGFEIGAVRGVVWRGHDAQVRVHHRACPHMGADLAQAEVCASSLRCRFHGQVVGDTEPSLIARSVPHRIGDDEVLVFASPPGWVGDVWEPLEFELWREGTAASGHFEDATPAGPLTVVEGVFDLAHFGPIHGRAPTVDSVEFGPRHARIVVTADLGTGPPRTFETVLDGLSRVRQTVRFGRYVHTTYATALPTAEGWVSRTAVTCEGPSLRAAQRIIDNLHEAAMDDRRTDEVIWKTRRMDAVAHYTRRDELLRRFRMWASTFLAAGAVA